MLLTTKVTNLTMFSLTKPFRTLILQESRNSLFNKIKQKASNISCSFAKEGFAYLDDYTNRPKAHGIIASFLEMDANFTSLYKYFTLNKKKNRLRELHTVDTL